MAIGLANLGAQQPAGPPPGPPGGGGGGDDVPQLITLAIQVLHRAFAAETDPIDKQALAKLVADAQAILAQEQKEKDQLMGGPGMRALRRNR